MNNARPCPNYPGYSATADGRVFSNRRRRKLVGRHGGSEAFIDPTYWRELRGTESPKGYVVVGTRGSRTRRAGVHQLVMDAFGSQAPAEGLQVRHLDDDPKNNHISNLAWGTHADNAADRKRNGGYAAGSHHPNAKLSQADVHAIRSLRQQRVKVKELAKRFCVSVATIEGVISGRSYKPVSFKVISPADVTPPARGGRATR